jgi:uncharacterized protein
MNRSLHIFAMVTLLFSMDTHAVTEDGRAKAAMRLLDAMDMRVNLARTVEQVTEAEVEKTPALVPYKSVLLEFMNKYMGYDNIKADLAKLYADAYTQSELEELARFYQTPVGKKLLNKLPELTVQGARLGQQKVEEHLDELRALVARESQRIQSLQAK